MCKIVFLKFVSNLHVSCTVGKAIPVTLCECKREISVLRKVKTYLRNTMNEDRLNALTLMSIYRDIPIDFVNVINCSAPGRAKLLIAKPSPNFKTSPFNTASLSRVRVHSCAS